MPEFVREVTITVEVDTNKRTVSRQYAGLRAAANVLRKLASATNLAEALDELEVETDG